MANTVCTCTKRGSETHISMKIVLLLAPLCLSAVEVDADGETRKAYMPAWDDEEESTFNKDLPEKFKCDGCRGVAFMLTKSFAQREAEVSNGGELPESEFFHEIEATCDERLEGKFGVKARNANPHDKVFSGPGLKAYELDDAQFGGLYWDKRIKKLCRELADAVGEEEIYAMHRDPSKPLAKALCKRHCAKPKKEKRKHQKKAAVKTTAKTTAGKAAAQKKQAEAATAADCAEVAALRAENVELKQKLASCEQEVGTVKKSLSDMIDIMDK